MWVIPSCSEMLVDFSSYIEASSLFPARGSTRASSQCSSAAVNKTASRINERTQPGILKCDVLLQTQADIAIGLIKITPFCMDQGYEI